MRGGTLSFNTNITMKKKIQIQNTQIVFTNFIQIGNIESTQNELR